MRTPIVILAFVLLPWIQAQEPVQDVLGSYQQAMIANREEDRPRAFFSGPVELGKYSTWTSHSNGLVGAWTFGTKLGLAPMLGENSAYRSAIALERIYGRVPEHSLQVEADYGDQTDLSVALRNAVDAGAKQIFIVVVDGLGARFVAEGEAWYGTETLAWLNYQAQYEGQASAQSGHVVTSPHSAGKLHGGFDPARALSDPEDLFYIIAKKNPKSKDAPHAVTDSAASATSIFSGIKTRNGSVNYDITGNAHTPLGAYLQAKGWRVGAVTDVPFPHATPACFYTQAPTRIQYKNIAKQMLGRPEQQRPGGDQLPGLDVVMGAGYAQRNRLDQDQYIDPRDLSALREASSPYRVHIPDIHSGTDGPGALRSVVDEVTKNIRAKSGPQRLLVLAGDATLDHLPYRTANEDYQPVDTIRSASGDLQVRGKREVYSSHQLGAQPNLALMAGAAIEVLEAYQEPFALMIEAGQFDWAMHANSVDNGMGELLSVAQVFDHIRTWVEAQPGGWQDAVLLITADHDHAVRFDPEAYAKLRALDASFWTESTRQPR